MREIKRMLAVAVSIAILFCNCVFGLDTGATEAVAAAKYVVKTTVNVGENGKAKVKLKPLLKKGDRVASYRDKDGYLIDEHQWFIDMEQGYRGGRYLIIEAYSYKNVITIKQERFKHRKNAWDYEIDHACVDIKTKQGGLIKLRINLNLTDEQRAYIKDKYKLISDGVFHMDLSKVNGNIPLFTNTTGYRSYVGNFSRVRESGLVRDGESFYRVEKTEKTILIEKYNSSYQMMSSKVISLNDPMGNGSVINEPIYGGFYCGEKYNFIFVGQNNKEQNNNREVIRIIKCDKEWNTISMASVNGHNTTIPFRGGSIGCAESGGILFVNTCHEMYNGHQANMHFTLNQETMTLSGYNTGVSSTDTGYCSHSFNQFVAIDGDDIYTLDHGDAYPRGIFLCRYKNKGDGSWGNPYALRVLVGFPGSIGDNNTNTYVGGLAVSDTHCLVTYYDKTDSNVMLAAVEKNKVGKGPINTKELKRVGSGGYGDDAGILVPRIIKTAEDRYVVYWTRINNGSLDTYYVSDYMVIDGKGEIISESRTIEGAINGCVPTVTNGMMQWYRTGNHESNGYCYYHISDEIFEKIKSGEITEWENPYDTLAMSDTVPIFCELNPLTGEFKQEMVAIPGQPNGPYDRGWNDKDRYFAYETDEGATVHLYYNGNEYTAVAKKTSEKLDKVATLTGVIWAKVKVPKSVFKDISKIYDRKKEGMYVVWATKEGMMSTPKYVVYYPE